MGLSDLSGCNSPPPPKLPVFFVSNGAGRTAVRCWSAVGHAAECYGPLTRGQASASKCKTVVGSHWIRYVDVDMVGAAAAPGMLNLQATAVPYHPQMCNVNA
jgi:hypothetical protein